MAYDLKLLSTGGRRQFDTNAIIARYDARIAMSCLADFILLGHDKVGTLALLVALQKKWALRSYSVFTAHFVCLHLPSTPNMCRRSIRPNTAS